MSSWPLIIHRFLVSHAPLALLQNYQIVESRIQVVSGLMYHLKVKGVQEGEVSQSYSLALILP